MIDKNTPKFFYQKSIRSKILQLLGGTTVQVYVAVWSGETIRNTLQIIMQYYIAIKDWIRYTNYSYATWGVVFLLFNRSTPSKAFQRSISGSILQKKVKHNIIIQKWMIYKIFDMQMKYKCTSNEPRWFYFFQGMHVND